MVPRETVRRYGCDALLTIERKCEAPLGEAGRARRVVPPSLRWALHRRDGGCRFPDCDRPPEWTDAHHLKHWADGASGVNFCQVSGLRSPRVFRSSGSRAGRADRRDIDLPAPARSKAPSAD